MRILVIADCIPFPPIGGGALRIYNFVRALAVQHKVTLVGFTYDKEPVSPPVEVVAVPWEEPTSASDEPLFARWTESDKLLEAVQRIAKAGFDLALIENSYMAGVLAVLPATLPKVLDLHDVHSLVAWRAVEGTEGEARERAIREAEKTVLYERQAAEQCVRCIVISDQEAEAARSLLGLDRVEVLPSGVDTSAFVPADHEPMSDQILFTGTMNFRPNIEAVRHFTAEILPLVRQRIHGVQFHIVGARPTEQVVALASESVVIHGQVVDVRPYFHEATVVVVPVLHGGGIRLKILEAAACGKAIVSTRLGAEGLHFTDGQDIVIVDTVPEFADSVARLLEDEHQRQQLGRSARKVSLAYDWKGIGARLQSILQSLI